MKAIVGVGVWIALACGLGGCKAEDQDRVVEQGRQVLASAKSAIGNAFGSLMQQAGKLDPQSPQKALTAARDKAIDLQKQLSSIKAPTSLDSLHLEAVTDQIDRLKAALTVQNLQNEWDAALKKANEGKNLAQDKIAETAKSLREADAKFRDIDDKLDAAKKAYATASDKVSETLGKGDKTPQGN